MSIPLPEGSVLLMKGWTQRYWKHAIHRESRPLGPRINLTFRRILSPAENPVAAGPCGTPAIMVASPLPELHA